MDGVNGCKIFMTKRADLYFDEHSIASIGPPLTPYIQGVATIRDTQTDEERGPCATIERLSRRADCPAPTSPSPVVTSPATSPLMIYPLHIPILPHACERISQSIFILVYSLFRYIDASTAPRCLLVAASGFAIADGRNLESEE
ncbi:hypothetical protein Y032_0226g2791 [Ancylostoma ceylanicum]|uniref:Uncharacterized protein n=1 Tax=Ancylostoma ceylanicum TaxID=53326 RepID=A0A016SHT5_9BILA|nr:hypothetical protein Y032_0226g2791 [Ancylostoma ceylanicum]